MNFYLIFLTLVFGLSSVQMHPIERRRVKPRSISLSELEKQCNLHGWTRCRNYIHDLQDPSSHWNKDYKRCRLEAKQTPTNTITITLNTTLKNISDENPTPSSNPRQLYCEYARTITQNIKLFLDKYKGVSLKDLSVCPSLKAVENDENDTLTATEIVEKIDIFVTQTTERRKNAENCSPCDETLKGLPNQVDSQRSPLTNNFFCHLSSSVSVERWEKGLFHIARLMRANELLTKLEKKRDGREGCVREGVKLAQIKCLENVGLIILHP